MRWQRSGTARTCSAIRPRRGRRSNRCDRARTTCSGSSTALGDHTPAGYRQRARFYGISAEGRLNFAKNIAAYIVFLAENTGLASAAACAGARTLLARYASLEEMLGDISR
jgi:hypothetical protein